MSTKAAVHTAVLNALAHDGKYYDPAQVMSANPYSYSVLGLMRDFLLDVAHELSTDTPPLSLNVDSLDLNKCMVSKENDFEAIICAALPQIS
jgi:hypothetical protein